MAGDKDASPEAAPEAPGGTPGEGAETSRDGGAAATEAQEREAASAAEAPDGEAPVVSEAREGEDEEAGEPTEPAAPAAPANENADAVAPEQSLEAQISELKDRLLRAVAEVENTRRRAERERLETSKYAVSAFARDVLPVADNLRRALEAAAPEVRDDETGLGSLLAGVEMTERELLSALERHSISAINPMGEKFDHNFHQVMFEVPGTGEPAGTIVQVMQTGYLIADRLLRPAMVGVAKNESPEEPGEHIDTTV